MHVILSVNNLEKYLNCVPIAVKKWLKFGYTPIIIYITEGEMDEDLPKQLKPYAKYVKVFKCPHGYPTGLVAQTIRLFYPAVYFNEADPRKMDEFIVITDADAVPLSAQVFEKDIPAITDKAKAYAFDYGCYRVHKEIAMFYFFATGQTFSRMFYDINTIEDIYKVYYNLEPLLLASAKTHNNIHGGNGWSCDQILLTRAFEKLGSLGEHKDLSFTYKRHEPSAGDFDKIGFDLTKSRIDDNYYLDSHIAPWRKLLDPETIEKFEWFLF
jgi:hypothetical protein